MGQTASRQSRSLSRMMLVAASLLTAATGCASSTSVAELTPTDAIQGAETAATPAPISPTPTEPAPPQVTPPAPAATRCREDGSYRARLVETDAQTAEVLTEYRYEVGDEHVRTERAGDGTGIVVIQDADAWTFDSTGWDQLPVVPVRPLRTPWVDNFVTGPAVAQAGTTSDSDTLYGFDVRQVALTYDQFSNAFPQKVRDADYVPEGSSFVYWLDPCDQIVRAEVTTTFGSETAELMGPDFPLVLSYLYESYDVGPSLVAPTPGEPISPIPSPSDS